nr:glycolipid transfer protein 1-like [Ipomoea batatas]
MCECASYCLSRCCDGVLLRQLDRGIIAKMEGTLFSPALEGLKLLKCERGDIQTKPFLDVCKFVLPILDKFGASMTVVKADISGNISRLDSRYNSNTPRFNYLYSFVQAEIETGTAKSSSSCTNGLLWAMDFIVELFRNLGEHRDWSMSQACSDSYSKTLKKWHGWLASSSFMVAVKLVPDRKKFMEVLGGEDSYGDMENFCTAFTPILKDIHKFLASCGLDNMKSS